MAEFKPMVKMETTEPSVSLKMKDGGHVNMKNGGMAMGGMPMGGFKGMGKPKMKASSALQALKDNPALVGRPAINALVRSPGKPSMADRKAAMRASRRAGPPTMTAEGPNPMPGAMKEGGKADMAQDKAMIKKAVKQHDDQQHPKSKDTKLTLKNGGKMATGDVVKGKAGYKDGGCAMPTAKAKGGSAKKAYATGGSVNSGAPVAMPQGNKKPQPPIRINQLTGVYKDGGKVEDMSKGAYDRFYAEEKAENEAMRDSILGFPGRMADKVKSLFSSSKPAGSVTKTEKSVTVSPGKKNGGKC
jgi:hypothetical protein